MASPLAAELAPGSRPPLGPGDYGRISPSPPPLGSLGPPVPYFSLGVVTGVADSR